MKAKLAKNFEKASTFIFSALVSIAAFLTYFFELLPPETFGDYGALGVALVAFINAILRVWPQESASGNG